VKIWGLGFERDNDSTACKKIKAIMLANNMDMLSENCMVE